MNSSGRLCWLDLEMTGLNAEVDKILEIAALVSDFDNNIIFPGMSAIIHYPESEMPHMDTWVKNQHTKSGLLKTVAASEKDLESIEEIFYNAIKPYCIAGKTFLAGNTVYQDRIFLKKYMPRLDSLFHHRLIDVSTLKELIAKWYPSDEKSEFKKNKEHRALADIYESMAELKHYKTYFFKM